MRSAHSSTSPSSPWLPLWLLALAWCGALLGEQVELAWTMGMAPTEELGQALFLGLAPLPLALLVFAALVASWRAWRTSRVPLASSPVGVTGQLLGGLFAACVFLACSYLFSLRVVLGLSNPVFVAAALALGNLALGLVAALLSRGLGALFGSGLERIADSRVAPALRCIVPAWRLVLGLCILGLLVSAWAVHKRQDVVEAVDWPRGLAMLAGATSFAAGAWFLRRRRYGSWALAGLTLVSSLALLFAPGMSRALWLVGPPREVSWSAAVGLRLLRASLDFDHDGRLSFAGDGDCAAFDPSRHPMAVDIPGDGIDQDCDGRDAVPGEVEFASFHTTLLPSGFDRRPPLVLLLTVDAFNPRRLRTFGAERDPMPQLDRFFESAVLFRSAFAQGPSTRLSFPATFTSRWDSEIPRRLEGRHPYPLEDSVTTLAERFERADYRTAAVLPDALFRPSRWHGLLQGFQRNELALPAAGHHHGAQQVTDAAVAELARAAGHPLFLWVHYFDAHSPHRHPRGEPDYGTQMVDRYDAELHHVDTQLGRLLAEVRRRYGDDAWIIVTGDHARLRRAPTHAPRLRLRPLRERAACAPRDADPWR
ncbi:MAG: sulfatase-like hydrolase/transferase [Deltaproteobacteria bacterium]|nr:sulfatase-like hydrolase/transferase [Deltaproteobacteria bacterium]